MKAKALRAGKNSEKQILLGFSREDMMLIEKAAAACEIKRGPFIREAAVYWADKLLSEDEEA